jgi:pyridoxine 4-dehydrogenase
VTALDTAYNYQQFEAHRALAAAAGDLLEHFEISTKVGFFADSHSLEPARLRAAVEQAADELGRIPDTVLLHNPECSPEGFEGACGTLTALRDAGLCRAWGLSTWDPRPLLSVADDAEPDAVMVRAGLTVPAPVLDAAEQLATTLRCRHVWGMAPFGGSTSDTVWTTVNTSLFLEPGQNATNLAAGFAAAFAIPRVDRIAVGTSRPDHLADLVAACELEPGQETIPRYRELLRTGTSVGAGT